MSPDGRAGSGTARADQRPGSYVHQHVLSCWKLAPFSSQARLGREECGGTFWIPAENRAGTILVALPPGRTRVAHVCQAARKVPPPGRASRRSWGGGEVLPMGSRGFYGEPRQLLRTGTPATSGPAEGKGPRVGGPWAKLGDQRRPDLAASSLSPRHGTKGHLRAKRRRPEADKNSGGGSKGPGTAATGKAGQGGAAWPETRARAPSLRPSAFTENGGFRRARDFR